MPLYLEYSLLVTAHIISNILCARPLSLLQMRFCAHLEAVALELLMVTPAFITHGGAWQHVLSTTLATYALSLATGYALDLSTRRVFLRSRAAVRHLALRGVAPPKVGKVGMQPAKG